MDFGDNDVNVGSLIVTNVALWCGMPVEEAVCIWGHGVCGNFMYRLFNFAVNLKLL